jgi:hypothetical protein
MVKVAIAALAAVVAGCATAGYEKAVEYQKGERVIVPSEADKLAVQLHPTQPGRAIVQPTSGRLFATLMVSYDPTLWLARVAEHRPAYDAALRTVIQKEGATCDITNAQPWPHSYMIEYSYSCKD